VIRRIRAWLERRRRPLPDLISHDEAIRRFGYEVRMAELRVRRAQPPK